MQRVRADSTQAVKQHEQPRVLSCSELKPSTLRNKFATNLQRSGALYEICNHDALSIVEPDVFDQVYSLIRRAWNACHLASSYIRNLPGAPEGGREGGPKGLRSQ